GLPGQREATLATPRRRESDARSNKENQMRALDRLERMRLTRQLVESRASVPDGGDGSVPGGDAEALAARLSRLNQELMELRTRFSDKYPDVIRVNAEIAALEGQRAETKTDGRTATNATSSANPSPLRLRKFRSEAEEELTALKEEEKALRQSVAKYQQRVDLAPHREQEYQELSRDYKTMKELYNALLQRSQESQVVESMQHGQKGEQFRLLDHE